MLNVSTKSPIQDLLDQSIEQDTHKADYRGTAKEFKFDEASKLITPTPHTPGLAPTPWAWSQTFKRLGPVVFGRDKTLPADYLLALRPEQRAELLNDHIQHTDQKWLVRSYDDTARAVLSDRYVTSFDNTALLDILNQISAGTEQEHKITRTTSVTPDSLNVRIIWKDVQVQSDNPRNKDWGIGVYIRNGEIGNRKGGVYPLIQRHSCQNSIIVDASQTGYEFWHLGNPTSKLTLVKAAITDVLPFAAKLLDDMIKADAKQIPDFADTIAGLCKQYNWTDATKAEIAIGSEGRDTKAGLVNGITFAAHRVEDPNAKAELEAAGGAILLAADSVFHRAASVGRTG